MINLNKLLNYRHKELFQSADRELVVYGGANAGKSYSIADKLLIQSILHSDKRMKTVIVRKTLNSLKKTALDILQRRAEAMELPFELNRSEWTARVNNMEFIMTGMNNQEDYLKVKSLTDVDFIWVNEAAELRENDYKELTLRLRGAKKDGCFRQIICDFNPIGKMSWVFERFFQNGSRARKLRYTVLDNPWAEEEYIEQLKQTKESDPNFYKIYFLGEWGELEGVIFNWDVVPEPPENPDEVFYGGDFGYSVDPTALVRIYRKADEFWVEEVIYETGLTNIELGKRMISLEIENAESYWDAAEPKSIQELYDMGINAFPSSKGPDSVRAGIDFLKEQTIHIIDGSTNIIKEQKSYVWKKDKDGNSLNEPIAFNNHAMGAIRYGIYTHCKERIMPKVWRP